MEIYNKKQPKEFKMSTSEEQGWEIESQWVWETVIEPFFYQLISTLISENYGFVYSWKK